MRRMLWLIAAGVLAFPAASLCAQEQQQSQSQQTQSQSQSDSQKTQQQSASSASQNKTGSQASQSQDSLADAARKAREQKKDSPRPTAKVFTNDNLPSGGISTVGEEKGSESATAAGSAEGAQAGANDEKTWRNRFAKLRHKLEQDQDELDVLQREIGVAQMQYYGGDPNKAMNDQASQTPFGADYAKKLDEIEAKKKAVEADKQAISDAEDELRKAGGDPGWAR